MEGESVAMVVAFRSARKREEIMAGNANLEEEGTSQQQQEGALTPGWRFLDGFA